MATRTRRPAQRTLDIAPDQLLLVQPQVIANLVATVNGIAVYAHRDDSDWLWSFNVIAGEGGSIMLYAHKRPDTEWSMPLRMAQPVIDNFGTMPSNQEALLSFARYFLAPS